MATTLSGLANMLGGLGQTAMQGAMNTASNQMTNQMSQQAANSAFNLQGLSYQQVQNTYNQAMQGSGNVWVGPISVPVTVKVGDVMHIPDEGFMVLQVGEYVQDNNPYYQTMPYTGSQTHIGHGNSLVGGAGTIAPSMNPFLGGLTATPSTTTYTYGTTTAYPSITSTCSPMLTISPIANNFTAYQYAQWLKCESSEEDGDWFELLATQTKLGHSVGVLISIKSGKLVENVYLGGLETDKFMTQVNNATKEDECPKAE